jgi:peptide deformylase
MGVYQIVKDGDPVLREKAKVIKEVTASTLRLLDNLKDTLHSTSNGVGLAAPQIGISKRAIVVETEEDGLLEMVNPEILSCEGQAEDWEGCLSCPGLEGVVPRATKISVRYLDRAGECQKLLAQDFLARIIQHEVDHLEGVLFIDKAHSINQEHQQK